MFAEYGTLTFYVVLQSSMRDYRIDNAKGILIALVVLGHLLESANGWQTPLLRGVLTAIYMFHMPAFAFLTGVTVKTETTGRRMALLAIMLVVFQVAYLISLVIAGNRPDISLLQPYWILWFLLSMIWWLALLPLVKRTGWPVVLAAAMALVVGAIPWVGYGLSLSRTFVFFPFFVAGHLYGPALVDRMSSRPAIAKGLLLLFVPAAAMILYGFGLDAKWFYGSVGYASLGIDAAEGVVVRGALLLVAAVATLVVLGIMPSRATVLSRVGTASLSVYLLHGFVVNALRQPMNALPASLGEVLTLAAAIALSAVATALLAAPVFDRWIRRFAESVVAFSRRAARRRAR